MGVFYSQFDNTESIIDKKKNDSLEKSNSVINSFPRLYSNTNSTPGNTASRVIEKNEKLFSGGYIMTVGLLCDWDYGWEYLYLFIID